MVKVSDEACIGCGACQALVSDVFDINDEGYAYVMEDANIKEHEEEIEEAINNCPTGAISKED